MKDDEEKIQIILSFLHSSGVKEDNPEEVKDIIITEEIKELLDKLGYKYCDKQVQEFEEPIKELLQMIYELYYKQMNLEYVLESEYSKLNTEKLISLLENDLRVKQIKSKWET